MVRNLWIGMGCILGENIKEVNIKMEKLKPCPFCGGENIFIMDDMCGLNWASCSSCLTDGPVKNTEKEAVMAWNKRV